MTKSTQGIMYAAVAIVIIGGGYFFFAAKPWVAGPAGGGAGTNVALASFTNAKGEAWAIPTGRYEFSVSSDRSLTPSFLWGEIDPLDVQPGDIQRMKVIVGDAVGIKSVTAEFETDTKMWKVPLRLTGTEAGAALPSPYAVSADNTLAVGDMPPPAVGSGTVSVARAETAARYTFEGEWKVEDTHRETYHTVFTAEDADGKKNTLVMAWSDPACTFILGVLTDDCTISGGNLEGVGGMNITFKPASVGGPYTINLATGTLAFEPGHAIYFANGQIIIGNGSKIEKNFIFQTDADGDRYSPSVALYTTSSPAWAGHVRLASSTTGSNSANIDCNDSLATAYPGSTHYGSATTGWTSGPAGDYNCNGTASAIINGVSKFFSESSFDDQPLRDMYIPSGGCMLIDKHSCGNHINAPGDLSTDAACDRIIDDAWEVCQ
ncbi:MAG: hypothetical protein V1656_00380 [Candidatus Jorgensenbacteria bacterium]